MLCGSSDTEPVGKDGQPPVGDSCLACGLLVSRGLQDPEVDADGRPRETLAARALRHRRLVVIK